MSAASISGKYDVIRCWRVVKRNRGRLPSFPSLPGNSISSRAVASETCHRSIRSQNWRADKTRPNGLIGALSLSCRVSGGFPMVRYRGTSRLYVSKVSLIGFRLGSRASAAQLRRAALDLHQQRYLRLAITARMAGRRPLGGEPCLVLQHAHTMFARLGGKHRLMTHASEEPWRQVAPQLSAWLPWLVSSRCWPASAQTPGPGSSSTPPSGR